MERGSESRTTGGLWMLKQTMTDGCNRQANPQEPNQTPQRQPRYLENAQSKTLGWIAQRPQNDKSMMWKLKNIQWVQHEYLNI